MLNSSKQDIEKKIVICQDGPYLVQGGIPLVRKSQIISEYGEPLNWKREESLETEENYYLCRCGHSAHRPFCDQSHRKIGFQGMEVADLRPTAQRQITLPGGKNIIVRRDFSLCTSAGFCATRLASIDQIMAESDESQVRSLIMAMIERCPSGSYTYSLDENSSDVEPDLPQQIAITTEITSRGPVPGPLWVTGYIPIELSNGQLLELRNRVTLCCCGKSKNKPYCDGAHRL